MAPDRSFSKASLQSLWCLSRKTVPLPLPLPFPIDLPLMTKPLYQHLSKPAHLIMRFEALWSVDLAPRRSHAKTIRQLLQQLQPVTKDAYEPSFARCSGLSATVVHTTMEVVDSEGSWPDW